jgi:2-haloacid dehalogenase
VTGVDGYVFDLGGVLLDWNPRHLYRRLFADHAQMEDFLARICTPAWHRAHDLGADIRESCRRLAAEHPGYRNEIMAWAERGEEMIAAQIEENVELLHELKASGHRVYALSNMERETFPVRRCRFPFMTWFDGVVISGFERVAKPDRAIFEILLRRYRLRPQATVFVDDTASNVEAARRLGIWAIHYSGPAQLQAALSSLASLEPAG